MTLAEKLRFVLLYGKISKVDGEWVWTAAPDRNCVIREMQSKSKWQIVETIYYNLKEWSTKNS